MLRPRKRLKKTKTEMAAYNPVGAINEYFQKLSTREHITPVYKDDMMGSGHGFQCTLVLPEFTTGGQKSDAQHFVGTGLSKREAKTKAAQLGVAYLQAKYLMPATTPPATLLASGTPAQAMPGSLPGSALASTAALASPAVTPTRAGAAPAQVSVLSGQQPAPMNTPKGNWSTVAPVTPGAAGTTGAAGVALPKFSPPPAGWLCQQCGVDDVDVLDEEEVREKLRQAIREQQQLVNYVHAVEARMEAAIRLLEGTGQ